MNAERAKKIALVEQRLKDGFYNDPEILRCAVDRMVTKTALDMQNQDN